MEAIGSVVFMYQWTYQVCSCEGFFFQADDGIRDHCVTGVQTCALPILTPSVPRRPTRRASGRLGDRWERSEERRVGKGFRTRWMKIDLKKCRDRLRNMLASPAIHIHALSGTTTSCNPATRQQRREMMAA